MIQRHGLSLEPAKLGAILLLLFAVGFNLVQLYPEVAIEVPNQNDGVLHRLALDRVARSLTGEGNPIDPWFAPVTMGYPLFHYYQPLPYLLPAILNVVSFGTLPPSGLFSWTGYLLLSLFPLSVFWSMRRMDFDLLPAALSGLTASLVSTDLLYGFDFSSYVWGGLGMYTQLWVMLLLPPTLAQCYVTLREGRGYFWATLLLSATLLSHLLLGYVALASVALLALLGFLQPGGQKTVWVRGRRLLLLLTLVASVTAYFWIPFVLNSAYFNRSVWEAAEKYDSYGHRWVLGSLVRGELFDHDRWPVFTLLVFAGGVVCVRRWRDERYRLPVVLFVVWLLLYFGRPTWGALLDLLPMSGDLRLNRLIAGVHLAGIYLAGIGLAIPWRWARSRSDRRYLIVPTILTILFLFPAWQERRAYLAQSASWMKESHVAQVAEQQDLEALLENLRRLPPGRVYAGRGTNWGRDYTVGHVPFYALLPGAGLDMMGQLYHAMSLNADIQVLFDHTRPDHYNLFNVRYLVVPGDRAVTDYFLPVGEFGRHRIYLVPTTGYFDLVESAPTFRGDKSEFYAAASHWLSSDLPRAKQHPVVLLDEPGETNREQLPLARAVEVIDQMSLPVASSPGRILSESNEEEGIYAAEVETSRETTLMLKVTYHPNWRATVDGVTAETMMLMPSFIGVRVPAGSHSVRLTYRPRAIRIVLLFLGLMVLPLIAIGERRVVRSLLVTRVG